MNFNNYTIKAQEAVQKATEIAGANQQQAVETGHLLKGLFQSDEKRACRFWPRSWAPTSTSSRPASMPWWPPTPR